jgi:hypothetical protein
MGRTQLPILPVHIRVFLGSNPAMKSNTGSWVQQITTILLPIQSQKLLHIMLHCWNQVFQIVGFPGCSQNINSSWCTKTAWRKTHLTSHHHMIPVAWCQGFMVVTPLFTHLSVIISNQRFSKCSPNMNVGFVKFMFDSFCWNRVFKTEQYSVLLSPVPQQFQFFWNNPSQCTMIYLSFCQRWFPPLFLFADAVFPWFVYADINLETATLSTPNNVADFVTDAPVKPAPIICPL